MDEGGRASAGCIRIRCPSPRRIMSRWFSSHGNLKGKKKKKKTATTEGRVRDECDQVRFRNLSEDDHPVGEFSDSSPLTNGSELQSREFMFSLGVSCYLLRLIATSREEMNKVVELRNEIERFLQCQSDELRQKQQEFVEIRKGIEKVMECHNHILRQKQRVFLSGKKESSETCAYSTRSDVVDGPESSTDLYYSPQISDTTMSVGLEGSLNQFVFKRGGEMDQLEAELEAEFELLQIGDQNQEGQSSKLKEVVLERSEDLVGVRFGHMCPRQVEEQQGVCPHELERRLYELMETRQEEEIKELETALEDAKYRLHVKEAEASWWKDTAYIVSEHIPEPSRITPNSRTRHYPLSR